MGKFSFNDIDHKWYRYSFIILLFIFLVVMVSGSDRYGICWDEPLQKEYGELALKFYTSGGKDTTFINHQKLTHLYGGLVEITSAVLTNNYKGDVYDRRHLYICFYGLLAILFAGLLAQKIGGWRAGNLALLFLFFSPVFFGHSMFNSKDIPFAATYIMINN